MNQGNDLLPSSPTISSVSSSDLDTESTGSFFHDRSTTLGTLMGVTYPAIAFRVSSHHENHNEAASANLPERRKGKKPKPERRRRPWWRLCREDSRPPSLGDFLEIERRFGDGSGNNRFFYDAPELEPVPVNGNGSLFADGRVLPPARPDSPSPAGTLCRCPVSITGVCCSGQG